MGSYIITIFIFTILLVFISTLPYIFNEEKFQMNVIPNNMSCSDYLSEKNPTLLQEIQNDPVRKDVIHDFVRGVSPVYEVNDISYPDLNVCVLDNDKKSIYGLTNTSCTLCNFNMNMFSSNSHYPYGCYIDPENSNFPSLLTNMYNIKNNPLLQLRTTTYCNLIYTQNSNNTLNNILQGINSNIQYYQTLSSSLNLNAAKQQYETESNTYYTLLSSVNNIGTFDSGGAISAQQIKDLTNTTSDGIYYIKCGNTPRKTFCLMNPLYDGGGWMLLMKMGIGDTFGFSSPHWTTATTLNEMSLNITNIVDAKFDVFNHVPIKDIMLIFLKDDINGYTGGSIQNSLGWCWLLRDWYNNGQKIEAVNGFNISRAANPSDPYSFSGWNANIFSTQSGQAIHVIGGHGYKGNGWSGDKGDWGSVRWGFVFNNENDMFSNDVWCGIGLGKTKNSTILPFFTIPDRSAGDYYGCCGTEKLNRSVRCLLFGR